MASPILRSGLEMSNWGVLKLLPGSNRPIVSLPQFTLKFLRGVEEEYLMGPPIMKILSSKAKSFRFSETQSKFKVLVSVCFITEGRSP